MMARMQGLDRVTCLGLAVFTACSARGAQDPARAEAGPRDARATPDAAIDARNVDEIIADMVTVPAGDFLVGCDRAVEKPFCEHDVTRAYLPPFYIDRTEVTVAGYRRCVEAGRCTVPQLGEFCSPDESNWHREGRDDHPVTCVTEEQAEVYCAYRGKALPTEKQWEKAARGTDGRRYAWGNEAPDCTRAVIFPRGGKRGCGRNGTWPVGSRPEGASPYGALDMTGNVAELVTDGSFMRDPREQRRVPRPPATKGGDYRMPPKVSDLLTWSSFITIATAESGFRCAYVPPDVPPP